MICTVEMRWNIYVCLLSLLLKRAFLFRTSKRGLSFCVLNPSKPPTVFLSLTCNLLLRPLPIVARHMYTGMVCMCVPLVVHAMPELSRLLLWCTRPPVDDSRLTFRAANFRFQHLRTTQIGLSFRHFALAASAISGRHSRGHYLVLLECDQNIFGISNILGVMATIMFVQVREGHLRRVSNHDQIPTDVMLGTVA